MWTSHCLELRSKIYDLYRRCSRLAIPFEDKARYQIHTDTIPRAFHFPAVRGTSLCFSVLPSIGPVHRHPGPDGHALDLTGLVATVPQGRSTHGSESTDPALRRRFPSRRVDVLFPPTTASTTFLVVFIRGFSSRPQSISGRTSSRTRIHLRIPHTSTTRPPQRFFHVSSPSMNFRLSENGDFGSVG